MVRSLPRVTPLRWISLASAPAGGWWLGVIIVVLLGSAPMARAGGNDPEKAQRRAEGNLVPKVAFACGVTLSITYDGDSLRRHNADIRNDQNDGEAECDDPLRYLWYACKTEAGRAAVRAAHISKVVCRGVPGPVGSLAVAHGTITAGRSTDERNSALRSAKQFESSFGLSLKLPAADPSDDQDWRALAGQPNPVTSTTTYCLVNGAKVDLEKNGSEPYGNAGPDATVKCWNDGEVVADLKITTGRKSGFLTRFFDKGSSRRISYRDGKEHGEQKTMEGGRVRSLAFYDNGQRVWEKALYPTGALKRYVHTAGNAYGELSMTDAGKVYQLRCAPAFRDDKELKKACGFEGAVTTSIYDGTGKVNRVLTWKNGVLEKEGAGDSAYSQRNEVGYVDGKKQGEERLLRKDGTRASSIAWNKGVKDGRELTYSDDGKKVVKEIVWKEGETKEMTEFFLNGNPRRKETYAVRDHRSVKTFWDTGKIASEGDEARCRDDVDDFGPRKWCEEGVQKSSFETGAPAKEETFVHGLRQGIAKSWWENGKPASIEEYAADKLAKAKRWDKEGKLVSDDEYEADGSRKLKH